MNQIVEPKNHNNQAPAINLKDIEKISLVNDDLVIQFKNNQEGKTFQTITSEQINNSQELRTIKSYLKKNKQNSLNQQELDSIFNKQNNNSISNEKPKGDNNALLIGGGIGILIIIGGIGLFLKRRKKISKKVN